MPVTAETPAAPSSSRFFRGRWLPGAAIGALLACGSAAEADSPPASGGEARKTTQTEPQSPPATGDLTTPAVGVADRGIFSDLDPDVRLALPRDLGTRPRAVHDPRRQLLIVYADDEGSAEPPRPVKIYPTGSGPRTAVGGTELRLRPADAAELAGALPAGSVTELPRGAAPYPGDADGDGIPDPLDLLLGAHKTALNGAAYGAGYLRIDYPGGDVPRDVGVCTDVVIRAVRNAGTDLQRELQRDIRRARRAYPMVKRLNPNINHRRVKTLLPYFKRHWDERNAALDSKRDPVRPGDVVFMDTFPSRSGPDHIGIVSDRRGDSGHLLVINNWTDGSKTGEMDLLGWVPVTHRFRVRSRGRRGATAPAP